MHPKSHLLHMDHITGSGIPTEASFFGSLAKRWGKRWALEMVNAWLVDVGEWLVGGVSRPIFCWFWTVSYRRGTIICLSHETLWVDVSVRSRIWMIWEYHEIISCSWDDSKLIRISTMIKEECMSQLGLNEKDLGIKEAGLPCLTVFFPVMSWSCWGLDVGLLLVCLFDCPGLCIPGRWIEKKTSATEAFEIHQKKSWPGTMGKNESSVTKKTSLLMEDLMNHFDQDLRPPTGWTHVIAGLPRPISWVSSNAREVFLVGSWRKGIEVQS